jgi:hypothetical protein
VEKKCIYKKQEGSMESDQGLIMHGEERSEVAPVVTYFKALP